jgi:hypothetical protein
MRGRVGQLQDSRRRPGARCESDGRRILGDEMRLAPINGAAAAAFLTAAAMLE